MESNKKFVDLLRKAISVTRGRISEREVFRDFIAFCALQLSVLTDPVHPERAEQLQKIKENYEAEELTAFSQTFLELAQIIERYIDQGVYEDLLGMAYNECGATNRALEQVFTPPDVARLMAQFVFGQPKELPSEGHFTLNDPTCGSGALLLAAAEQTAHNGYDTCEQLVIQASDVDICCVQMTYIQLALYGIPAVVVHGEVIAMKEYDRWYTPVYLWGKWVWRAPMPFGTVRNKSDEKLKMLDEPMYAACRQMEQLFRKKGETA